jgi:hypothetical protein
MQQNDAVLQDQSGIKEESRSYQGGIKESTIKNVLAPIMVMNRIIGGQHQRHCWLCAPDSAAHATCGETMHMA